MEEISQRDFHERFKRHMLDIAGPVFLGGEYVADYADEAYMGYWEILEDRLEGPEVCAENDISYWGEE